MVRRALVVMLLSLSAGCSGDGLRRVAVHGKVTAAGQPVDHAVIQFMPDGVTRGEGAIGRSDADGNYVLTTGSRQGHVGVVPGAYRVRVCRTVSRDGRVLGPDARQAENPGCWESIPERYSRSEPAYRVVVSDSGGAINIDIPEPVLSRD
jgi:hypothetical protein